MSAKTTDMSDDKAMSISKAALSDDKLAPTPANTNSSHANISTLNLDKLPILFDELALDKLDADTRSLIKRLDACLPQTQCGLCGYADGCLPYAHAIATKNEAIHLCVPGGDDTAMRLAQLSGRPYQAAMPSKWAIDPSSNRPILMRAVIDEDTCIGCTKCIPACPVDAIVGTAKHMHSIASALCTGCELCLPPCPVDCITLLPADTVADDTATHLQRFDENDLRRRYHAHLNRVAARLQSDNDAPVISHQQSKIANTLLSQAATTTQGTSLISADSAQSTIAAARLRSQIKKLAKQLSVRPDAAGEAKLKALESELARLDEA